MFSRQDKDRMKAYLKSDINKLNNIEKEEIALYIITDNPIKGLINFYRENDINVSNMFKSIEDLKSNIIMETNPTRFVIMDTGKGKFSSSMQIKSIVDVLGLTDENKKATIMYSNEVFKREIIKLLPRKIANTVDFVKYTTTCDAIEYLKRYNENYVEIEGFNAPDKNDVLDTEEEIMGYVGRKIYIDEKTRQNWEKLRLSERFDLSDSDIHVMSKIIADRIENMASDNIEKYKLVGIRYTI